ncbi:DUF4177 domain-containing protein [Halovulum dunhuangense]|uniref:DUF4177 domain-containing protein n=1 Tax=Halovulum dunhuangense TaxID=1505036 RepID=UPI001C0F1F0E|nr:DUF4177 domain-containing protein [Halovulum dunhuangense]
MPVYEYRIIPAPRRSKRSKGAKTPADRYAVTLTEVINAEARAGWEYLRADTLPVEEKQGMLSGTKEVLQTVLIFRREAVAMPEPRLSAAEPAPRRGFLGRAAEPAAPRPLGPADRAE